MGKGDKQAKLIDRRETTRQNKGRDYNLLIRDLCNLLTHRCNQAKRHLIHLCIVIPIKRYQKKRCPLSMLLTKRHQPYIE